MTQAVITGQCLVGGSARGIALTSSVPLSFWGGVSASTGKVIDEHHPLHGESVTDRVLVIPGSRGSCTGSGVLLELIDRDLAPAALVLCEQEEILTLGSIVAERLFDKSLPVMRIDSDDFKQLNTGVLLSMHDQSLVITDSVQEATHLPATTTDPVTTGGASSSDDGSDDGSVNISDDDSDENRDFHLSDSDMDMLNGHKGKAAQVAMQIIIRMAKVQGATALLSVSQAHIDACVYNGVSGLRFAQKLLNWGGKVSIPTTLNSISVDQRHWQQQGVDATLGEPASLLGDTYLQMGAQMSFTCAPYLLPSKPSLGEQIGWAESNAVVYANSILGARTQKYADFLDTCIALTGRAPNTGCHLDAGRLPQIRIRTELPPEANDAYWPLLGYHLGLVSSNKLAIVYGLENAKPTDDDLKAFCAAFATTSAVPMIHIAGITPEAMVADQHCRDQLDKLAILNIAPAELQSSWAELNSASHPAVDLICFGNPHFSLSECARLARLCHGRHRHKDVGVTVTLGRDVYSQADNAGYIETLSAFGVQFITDTCWCMLTEPLIPVHARVLMTNSGKYAHYAPGLAARKIYFDSLSQCVEAACKGTHHSCVPQWLQAKTLD